MVFHSDIPIKEEVDRYWNLTVGFSKDQGFNFLLDGFGSLFGYWIGFGFSSLSIGYLDFSINQLLPQN